MDISKLLPSIRTNPEQAKSLNSSLDSISSGIKVATQTSGPAEVSDWLHKYSSSFPATASPLTARSFADSAATSSPVSYLNSARQLGGEKAIKNFSSLVQMDKVAIKLGDPSFKQQKHLEGFSKALANLKFGTGESPVFRNPDESSIKLRIADESSIKLRIADESSIKLRVADESKAAIPYVGNVADESSIKLRIADESSIKLRVADESKAAIPYVGNVADESSIKLRIADESSIKLRVADESSIKLRVADESSIKLRVADAAVPLLGEAAPKAMFLGDIKDSSAIATLSADNADSMIQDANVFQRLSNFQSTLQQIASLNRGLEGK
jgi:hypothetical protein